MKNTVPTFSQYKKKKEEAQKSDNSNNTGVLTFSQFRQQKEATAQSTDTQKFDAPTFSQYKKNNMSKQPVSYLQYTGTPSTELQSKIADIDNKIKSLKSSWSASDKYDASRYRLDSLEKQKREYSNQLKAAVKQEEYIGKYNGYLSNTANTDYTDRSAYKTTVKNLSDNELKAQGWKKAEDGKWYKSHGETATFYSGDGDDTYEYINNPKARTTLDANMISATRGVTNYYRDQGLDLLSSEEKGIYNYLYSENKEKADEFLKFLSPTLQSRSIERTKQKASEAAEDSPVAASLYSIYSNLENGAIMPAKMVAAATGTYEDNPGLDIFDAQTKAIRGTVGEMADKTALGSVKIPVIDKNLGSFMYGNAMSIADMGAAIFLSGGNRKAMQAVMFSSAGSSAMTEAKENGADDGKALVLGLGSAFIEAITEKYSIEALFSKPKSAVNYFLKNVVAEGTEEGASDILNTVLDEVVSAIDGSQSQIRSDISSLVENEGLTEKEASKRVMLSWFQDFGADMLGGSISGAVMSAPQTASAAYNESHNSHYKKGVYSSMMTDSGTAAGIKSMPNAREITKGTKAVYDAAVKSSVLGADTIRQGLYDELDKKGYTPESAALNEINKALGYKNYTLSKLKLDGEMKGALESTVEKLAVAFDAGYFSERFDDVSGAMNAYAKAAAAGQAVGAYMLAERAAKADAENAQKLIKKAQKLLPGVKKGGSIEQSAEYIKTFARIGLDNINQTTADLRVDYLEDIVKVVGDAVMKENVRLDETQRRAINDTVLNGNVSANIDTILADESLTNILSDVFGMYIDGDTSVPAMENKVKGMIAAYRSGNGKRHQAVVNSRKLRMDMISMQLTGKGINDPEIFAGFRNAVFNGALTEGQAKAILHSEDAFNIFVKSTNGGITTKSGVEDMIKAAGLVAGFDLSLDSSAEYVDSGIKEVVNGRADVPLNETGIYDPDTGRLILNEKAEPQKKLSYTLAQHVVRDDFDSGNSNKYSYKELLKKPDIQIPKISEISEDKFNEYKSKKSNFIDDAIKNARLAGNDKNTDTATYLHCDDLNEDILVGRESFRHGAARFDTVYSNICLNLSDIIKNSVVISELSPRKNNAGSVVLLGISETRDNYILVRIIVNNRTWKAEDYKAVYAINKQAIKKEDVGSINLPPDYTASGGSSTSSIISISNLLEIVKDKKLINSVLSDDVLKNLQAERIVDENVTKNLVNYSESLADRLLDYMKILNIDLSDELKRAARKYNSYTLGNQARLNGTMLSEDNLQREIVADWLANAFLNEDVIEQLVTDDMSLAMELAERVKQIASLETAKGGNLADFSKETADTFERIINNSKADDSDGDGYNKSHNLKTAERDLMVMAHNAAFDAAYDTKSVGIDSNSDIPLVSPKNNYHGDPRTDAEVEESMIQNNLNRGGERSKRVSNASASIRKCISQTFSMFGIEKGNKRELSVLLGESLRNAQKNNSSPNDVVEETFEKLFESGYTDAEAMSFDEYDDLRNYLKYTRLYVSPEMQNQLPDYKDMIKTSWGKLNIVSNRRTSDMPIDMYYTELQQNFGEGMFPDITSESDQFLHIYGIANVFLQRQDSIKLTEFFRDNLQEAKSEYKETFNEYVKEFMSNSEIEKKTKDAANAQIERQKSALNKRYRERIEKLYHDQWRRNLEITLLKRLRSLTSKSKKQPLASRTELAETLGWINIASRSTTNKKRSKQLDIVGWWNDTKSELSNLGIQIEDKRLDAMANEVGQKDLSSFSDYDLIAINQISLKILHEYNSRNKLLSDIKFNTIDAMAKKCKNDLSSSVPMAKRKQNTESDIANERVAQSKHRSVKDVVVFSELSNKQFLDRVGGYGNSVFSEFAEKFQAAQTIESGCVQKWQNYLSVFLRSKENVKWFEKAHGENAEFVEIDISGKKYLITPMMRATLYYSLKNSTNTRRAAEGACLAHPKTYKAGRVTDAFLVDGTDVRIPPKELKKIADSATETEREYADLIMNFFKYVAPELNKVSLKIEGYEKFLVDSYLTISTKSTYIGTKDYTQRRASGNISEEKSRVFEANSPIIIEDLCDIVERCIKDYSQYIAYKSLIRDFNALMNYKSEIDNTKQSVQDWIAKRHGKDTLDRLIEMPNDILGKYNVKLKPIEKIINKYKGRFVQSVLLLNARSGLSQFTALLNIAPVVGYNSIIKGLSRSVKVETINKFTSIYFARKSGYGTKNHSDYTLGITLAKKLEPIVDFNQRVDLWTVRRVWGACESYVEDNFPTLVKSSDTYYKKVAEMYEKCIYETQANYNAMNRSDVLKTSGDLLKSLLMFKIEDFKTFGMLADAHGRLQAAAYREKLNGKGGSSQEYRTARKHFIKTVSSALAQMAAYAIFRRLWAALSGNDDRYRDENGEIDYTKEALTFISDMGKSMFGVIAFGDFAFDVIMSWLGKENPDYISLDVPALEMIVDTIKSMPDAFNAIWVAVTAKGIEVDERFKIATGPVEKLSEKLSGMFLGIPANNIKKIILNGALRVFPEERAAIINYLDPYVKNDLSGAKPENREPIIKAILSSRGIDVYEDTVSELRRLYESTGDNAVLPTSVPDSVTVDDQEIKLLLKDQKKYSEAYAHNASGYLNEIVDSSLYKSLSDEKKLEAINKIYSYASEKAKHVAMGEYELPTSTKKVDTVEDFGVEGYKYLLAAAVVGDLDGKDDEDEGVKGLLAKRRFDAVDDLSLDNYEKGIILSYMYSKPDNDVVNAFADTKDLLYNYVKCKAHVDNMPVVKGIPGYANKKKFDYVNSLDIPKVQKAHILEELLDIKKEKIINVTSGGISKYEYIKFKCITGRYTSNDDMSKREQVLEYIDNLNLSTVQKDILYFDSGYSEKTLYLAPWH